MDPSQARRAEGARPGYGPAGPLGGDLSAVLTLLDSLRRPLPPELRRQLTALLRETLLTMRALIDWYLERLERPARGPEVEDIPID
jgi:hypothetical protein